jgi:hypothetical protein
LDLAPSLAVITERLGAAPGEVINPNDDFPDGAFSCQSAGGSRGKKLLGQRRNLGAALDRLKARG